MRINVARTGMAGPFVQIIESVIVWVLLENVRIGDRQSKLFQPFVRNWRMNLRSLECRRQTVRSDKMFFRDKKSGPSAECPLRWLMQFFDRSIQLLCLGQWRCGSLSARRRHHT